MFMISMMKGERDCPDPVPLSRVSAVGCLSRDKRRKVSPEKGVSGRQARHTIILLQYFGVDTVPVSGTVRMCETQTSENVGIDLCQTSQRQY